VNGKEGGRERREGKVMMTITSIFSKFTPRWCCQPLPLQKPQANRRAGQVVYHSIHAPSVEAKDSGPYVASLLMMGEGSQ